MDTALTNSIVGTATALASRKDSDALNVRVLKKAQSALGDWHDQWQWLLRAEAEADLQPCVPGWRSTLLAAQAEADSALQVLTSKFAQPIE